MKYLAIIFGTSFIIEICNTYIAYKSNPVYQTYIVISMSVVAILVKFVSILIMIATSMVVVGDWKLAGYREKISILFF